MIKWVKNSLKQRETGLQAVIFEYSFANKKKPFDINRRVKNLVAGAGFEPTTFGLWARRATKLLHPASDGAYNTLNSGNGKPYFQKKRLFDYFKSKFNIKPPKCRILPDKIFSCYYRFHLIFDRLYTLFLQMMDLWWIGKHMLNGQAQRYFLP